MGMGGVGARSPYPTLGLEQIAKAARPFVASRFLPHAWRAIEQRRIQPKYTFHITDQAGRTLGLSGDDVQYPLLDEDFERLGDLVVALEDRRFFKHRGVDLKAIARALLANLRAGRIVQGGGTITQQLVRNTLLTPAPSVVRKLCEMVLAIKFEAHYTKREILRRYCELVYLGGGARGFAAAAHTIYRKSPRSLDDASICGLLGLLRAPSSTHPRRSTKRFVARQMFIAQCLRGKAGPASDETSTPSLNPIAVEVVRRPRWTPPIQRELVQLVGDSAANVVAVRSSLDGVTQDALDTAARRISRSSAVLSVAGVAIDIKTGGITAEAAWASGRRMEFSPAFAGRLQPGSTLKTFAVGAALEQGISDEELFESSPFEADIFRSRLSDPWRVRTYRDEYRGPIPLKDAFVASDNTVFARLIERLDLEKVFAFYRRFGVGCDARLTPAVVLGALPGGINLLALANAYAVIARGGVLIPPSMLTHARLASGEVVEKNRVASVRVISAELADTLHSLLLSSGKAFAGVRTAGKTGTTRRGHLYAGYDDDASYAVWVGFKHRQREGDRKAVGALDVMSGFFEGLLGHKASLLEIV